MEGLGQSFTPGVRQIHGPSESRKAARQMASASGGMYAGRKRAVFRAAKKPMAARIHAAAPKKLTRRAFNENPAVALL